MEQSKWATPTTTSTTQLKSQTQPPVLTQDTSVPIPSSAPLPPTIDATPLTDAPYPQIGAVSALEDSGDEFAQTRPPDDLFSDDIEAIADDEVYKALEPEVNSESDSMKMPRRPSKPPPAPQKPQVAAENDVTGLEVPRKEAVRGDRSGTGGIKKAKLTEEELAMRMEAIRLKNQSLEAAYARAEADEASFNLREAEAQQKRRLERQNRQQMMGEREKNRQRKMNALGGREWDAAKDENAFEGPTHGSQYRRGAHGGVAATVRPVEASDQAIRDNGSSNWRGRGGSRARGRGRGRGRGHDGDQTRAESFASTPQTVPTLSEFPSLPGKAVVDDIKGTPDKNANTDRSTAKTTWAEEMEDPPAA